MNTNDSSSLSPQKDLVGIQNDGNIRASAAALFARNHLQYLEKLNFAKSLHVELKMFSTEMSQCFNKSPQLFLHLQTLREVTYFLVCIMRPVKSLNVKRRK